MFEVPVSDLMSWGLISGDKIQGTLKYLDGENAITNVWGPGYFFPFKVISDNWDQYTSVTVGLVPSAGSGAISEALRLIISTYSSCCCDSACSSSCSSSVWTGACS